MLCLSKVCLYVRDLWEFGGTSQLFVLLWGGGGGISQTLVGNLQNTNILRLDTAAGFMTPKELWVNHRQGKV